MLRDGQPTGADAGYARSLLMEPMVLLLGAFVEGTLVGFALAYDLPEAISGARAGQLDDLFVLPEGRGHGVGEALIQQLVRDGVQRGWVHLRWMLPQGNPAAPLYDRIAERAPWSNYVIRIDRSVAW
jgi:GNAT superfamily N-acetyltransferase